MVKRQCPASLNILRIGLGPNVSLICSDYYGERGSGERGPKGDRTRNKASQRRLPFQDLTPAGCQNWPNLRSPSDRVGRSLGRGEVRFHSSANPLREETERPNKTPKLQAR